MIEGSVIRSWAMRYINRSERKKLNKNSTKTETKGIECRRCATCCVKGGPALHLDDRILIQSGQIPLKCLYTIRKNEPARDNVKGIIQPVQSDVVKLKEKDGSRTCCFLDEGSNCCTVYDHRPLECRLLKCWDTRDIEAIYNRERLTRKDIVSGVGEWWELIQDHEKSCSHKELARLVGALGDQGKRETARAIIQMVEYDTQIRTLLVDRGQMEPELLDFLFGKPLRVTIRAYGLRIEKKGDKQILRFE